MYFPIGWPKVLHSAGATCGRPVKVLRHRSRDLVVELRTSSVAIWHARVSEMLRYLCEFVRAQTHTTVVGCDFIACYRQLNVLLMSYSRSQQSLDTHGANSNVAMKPDGSVLLISVRRGRKAGQFFAIYVSEGVCVCVCVCVWCVCVVCVSVVCVCGVCGVCVWCVCGVCVVCVRACVCARVYACVCNVVVMCAVCGCGLVGLSVYKHANV